MKYDFDEVIERRGTYCTQWDYIEDRFGEKDLLPFSISDTDFRIPKPISDTIQKVAQHEIYGYTRWNHHDFKGSITGYFQRRFHVFRFSSDPAVIQTKGSYSELKTHV